MVETNIAWLWLPTVIFAHLFAGFWLVKTLLLNDPQALSCLWRRKKPVSKTVAHARALQKVAQAAAASAEGVVAADIILHVPRNKQSAGGTLLPYTEGVAGAFSVLRAARPHAAPFGSLYRLPPPQGNGWNC
jgi:hypothetical protein